QFGQLLRNLGPGNKSASLAPVFDEAPLDQILNRRPDRRPVDAEFGDELVFRGKPGTRDQYPAGDALDERVFHMGVLGKLALRIGSHDPMVTFGYFAVQTLPSHTKCL